jgi:glycosyltransferase involved in cell wall biosynthesis
MNLGILIPEFPTQTHVFFWREIQALERLGVNVVILSTKRPRDKCPHPFALEAAARTHYLFPPTPAAAQQLALHSRSLGAVSAYLRSIDRDSPELGGLRGIRRRALRRARHGAYLLAAAELVAQSRKHQLDHVHVHSCADAAHVVALAELLGGPPFSLHLHGDLPVYGRDHRQKMAHARFVAAAARPMQKQLIDEVGLPEDRTCTLIMGVNTERFAPDLERDGNGTKFRMITIGRLATCKGHKHALRAVRRIVDRDPTSKIHYEIVGDGPDRRAIEAEIDELGLGERVEMTGSLGEDAIASRLSRADAFVLSSVGIGEASPVAVMEAMAAGLPVVCSVIGGTPDMIENEVDGVLVAQGDEDTLAATLRRLEEQPELRKKLGRAARARAERQFDAVRRAEAMLAEIERTKDRSAAAHVA